MNRGGRQGSRSWLLTVCCLLCSAFSSLISCSTKQVVIPSFEGIELKDVLAEKGNLKSLKSTFSIELDRPGESINGDAVLRLTPDTLDLQIYSHGFLVAEVTSNKDFTKSAPTLDRKRLSMLVDGMRNSFLWWAVKDYNIEDSLDSYCLSSPLRTLIINKKTMLPEKQSIELEDGRQIEVLYTEPDFVNGIWFPTKIHIEMGSKSVKLKVKTLSVNN